jgi:hypothetical protein
VQYSLYSSSLGPLPSLYSTQAARLTAITLHFGPRLVFRDVIAGCYCWALLAKLNEINEIILVPCDAGYVQNCTGSFKTAKNMDRNSFWIVDFFNKKQKKM